MMENRNIGRQEVPTTQDFPQMQRFHNRPNTFVEVCGRSNAINQRGNRVTMETQGDFLNSSWWKMAVCCKASSLNPNWNWVKDRLQGVFGYAELKETSINEALEPWMGALKIDKSTKMDVLIAFSGLPYHLRARQVVETLAKKCGNQIEVDIMHLNYYETHCFAKIKNCEIHKVPRIIPVEEKGKVYYVWVEIDNDRLRSLARRPELETMVVQNKSPVNIPNCGIRDDCVHVDQLDINLDVGPNRHNPVPPGFERREMNCQISTGEVNFMSTDHGKADVDPVSEVQTTRTRRIQDGPSFLSPNRFDQLQAELVNPETISPLNIVSLVHHPRQQITDSERSEQMYDVSPRAEHEEIRPAFQPMENRRTRSRSKKGGRKFKTPLPIGRNKHFWRATQSKRMGRENSKGSKFRYPIQGDEDHSVQNNVIEEVESHIQVMEDHIQNSATVSVKGKEIIVDSL
ncbi:hypothetical protein FRX31_004485 [Thalictrum thalictroides]|uniref:Uncharacterized protein n=1 Tax=Thalictrum thalictroides TaxID=46969 RepID=A0A7J6XAB8_THATH|nr:hypothetical protein FRX31_004485 [Thalictrum thalictroides]